MWVLAGVGVVIIGFILRLNPLLVVAASAGATGWAAGLSPYELIAAFGKAFKGTREVSAIWIVLALIGVLEREGLQARARQLIESMRGATAGRVLLTYYPVRMITSALGLTSLGGHAQMVRPLIAPMTEAAARRSVKVETDSEMSEQVREVAKAQAAAADNIGLFFGEDIFIAIGSILLMRAFLAEQGINVEPLHLSLWAIPTALLALSIHGLRLWRLDRQLSRLQQRAAEKQA